VEGVCTWGEASGALTRVRLIHTGKGAGRLGVGLGASNGYGVRVGPKGSSKKWTGSVLCEGPIMGSTCHGGKEEE